MAVRNATTVTIAQVVLGDEEVAAAVDVLRSGALRAGEVTEQFEREFAAAVGARHAVAVSSGTAALHVVYLALLAPGDEVVVPSFTFVATASMVSLSGAVPVFADIDPKTFTLDPNDVARRITPRTRAIAGVHLFGHPCDVDAMHQLALEHDLRLVWDAAQAHGAHLAGRDVGSFGDAVCYSFYPTKNMTTAEGGMVTTDDGDLAERMRLIRSHGQVRKYEYDCLGLNYRPTDVSSAIGRVQLARLDQALAARRRHARLLTAALDGVDGVAPPLVAADADHAFNQYTVTLDLDQFRVGRERLIAELRERRVESAVNYAFRLHRQPIFGRSNDQTLPVTERACQRVLSLPVHQHLSVDQVALVSEALADVAAAVRR